MKSVEVILEPKESKEDFIIKYEDSNNQLHDITVPFDNIVSSINYFQKRSKEIHEMKSIYIHEYISFDFFNEFIKSAQTHKIIIDENNYRIFSYLSKKYEYVVLYEKICEYEQKLPQINKLIDELTAPNIDNEKYNNEIEELISQNLDTSLNNRNMHKIPLNILNRILNSPKMMIKNHHLLFSFVISMIKTKMTENLTPNEMDHLLILPGCLDYCRMTKEEIEELFQIEGSLNFFDPRNSKEKIGLMISKEKELSKRIDDLERQMKSNEDSTNEKIKESLKKIEKIEAIQNNLIKKDFEKRIEKVEANQNSFGERLNNHDLKLSKNEQIVKDLDQNLKILKKITKIKECSCGVFQYLSAKYGANPATNNKIIKIDGNSNTDPNPSKCIHEIVNPNWINYWYSKYEPNSYINIDFNNFLVKIKQYRIKVGWPDNSSFLFTSWILKGKTEKNEDIILDEVNQTEKIAKDHAEATFDIQDKPFVSSIKLIMKGNHNMGNQYKYAMCFRNIEIFGYIKE